MRMRRIVVGHLALTNLKYASPSPAKLSPWRTVAQLVQERLTRERHRHRFLDAPYALQLHLQAPRKALQKIAPSVVNVSLTEEEVQPVTHNHGSGVIVNADGTILTAFDLVANQPWFQRQWTPKGQIIVDLHDGRRIAAKLAVADKDLGIAVLKISSESPLTAALARERPFTFMNSSIHLDWTSSESNSVLGKIGSDKIQLLDDNCEDDDYDGKINFDFEDFDFESDDEYKGFGGPIIDYAGRVMGISQKQSSSDDSFILASPIESAMKMVEKMKVT